MSDSHPLVTIGIPTYNRANGTLSQAIRSALAQDYDNLEIVISNNCSTDNTEEVIRSFKDPRIRYLPQAVNVGPTNNYNAALKAAKGEYFLLLHDDDLIDPDLISSCLRAAKYSTEYSVIRTGTRIIGADGRLLRELPNVVGSNDPDDLFSAWVNWKTAFYLCSTLFHTRALQKIGGFHSPNNLFEDGFAIIKLSAEAPILNLLECKASFREHDDQRTFAQNPVHWYEDFREALDLIYRQKPGSRAETYRTGMRAFSTISLRFAFKVKSPYRKVLALVYVGKYFPHHYWPDVSESWKMRLIKQVARLVFGGRDALSQGL